MASRFSTPSSAVASTPASTLDRASASASTSDDSDDPHASASTSATPQPQRATMQTYVDATPSATTQWTTPSAPPTAALGLGDLAPPRVHRKRKRLVDAAAAAATAAKMAMALDATPSSLMRTGPQRVPIHTRMGHTPPPPGGPAHAQATHLQTQTRADEELSEMRHRRIAELRGLVRACLARRHLSSARFYAEKLATLSSASDDVLLLAETCMALGECHRAIHLVHRAGLLVVESPYSIPRATLQAFWLAAQSMLEIQQREECLDLLAKVVPDDEASIVAMARRLRETEPDMQTDLEIPTAELNLVASLVLLMAHAFEGVGNREHAVLYYRIALRCDVRCVEAFTQLTEKAMLSAPEQQRLLASLDFAEDDSQMLLELYDAQLCKYQSLPVIETKFASIESKFGLTNDIGLSIAKAETLYYHRDLQRAFSICTRVLEQDPFNFDVVPTYVATLVELAKKRVLYQYAHQLVDVYPKKACAWYTIGCYYLLIEKLDLAQRYFHKATTLDPNYAPAWIGFGNAFAAQDESDQAMSSYRTAAMLFPGCHLPPLYIGMEHLRTNNLPQALEFITQARTICPFDPLVYNELGAVYYKQKDFAMAIENFTKTLELCKDLPERLMESWEPTIFNLAQSNRKIRRYDQAIIHFQNALRLSPRRAETHAALGFTYHMKGDIDEAIECYHAALSFNSEDALAGEMIKIAFDESLSISHALPSITGLTLEATPRQDRASTPSTADALFSTPIRRSLVFETERHKKTPRARHASGHDNGSSDDNSMLVDDD